MVGSKKIQVTVPDPAEVCTEWGHETTFNSTGVLFLEFFGLELKIPLPDAKLKCEGAYVDELWKTEAGACELLSCSSRLSFSRAITAGK